MFDSAGQDLDIEMLSALFADRYIFVTVYAPRIEDTNGELSEDGMSIVWRPPLAQMIVKGDYQKSLETVGHKSLTIVEKLRNVIER